MQNYEQISAPTMSSLSLLSPLFWDSGFLSQIQKIMS